MCVCVWGGGGGGGGVDRKFLADDVTGHDLQAELS